MADETVTQRLEFDASQAIQALKDVDEKANTVAGKAELLNKKLQDYSRSLGQSWKTTLAQMKEQVGVGGDKFTGFQTPLGKDVTDDVFKQTEALARNAQAKNRFVTEDNNAAKAEMNFDGSVKQANISVAEQSKRLQTLAAELNKIKSPPQGRTATGQFTSATPPSFATQFAGLSSYQQQLKLVETTISNLQKKTNLPFKDIGRELGKSFPELLKDTNLVSTAVANLTRQNQGLSASFKTEAQSIRMVQNELTRLQAAGKINLTGSPQQVVNNLKEVIKTVSASTGAQYEQVGKQLQALGAPAELARRAVKGLNEELGHGVKNSRNFQHGIDVIRTALGTLVAVGIFTFLNAIQKGFTEATKAARELEDSLFRLTNVERILSQGGTEVTMKGLKDGIQEIKKLFPIFSQEDLTQLVAQISISTKELGLTEKQIIDLSKAIAVLNIRSTEEETASQTAQKVISSLITDNAKGIASLGLSFNENTMEIKGMELGIITATHKLKDLTNEEKAQIKYNILLENTGGELSNVNEYLDSNTAKIKANSAAWHDFLTTVGQGINNLIPDITPLIEKLQKSAELSGLDELIRSTGKTNIGLGSDPKLLAVQAKMFLGLKLTVEEYEHLKEVLSSIPDDEILKIFPDPSAIKDRFTRELVESIIEVKDTATGLPDPLIDANVDDSALDELSEKLQDIAIDAQHAREDLAILLEQKQEDLEIDFQFKLADLDTEYIQKAEDAAIDYGQKIEDINLDAQQKIEDAKRKAREDEEKAEAEFLMRMKHLRMDFLLDLDDALHARDARQVLRLIKEYNNDKQKLIDKKALDDQFRQESLEADLKNIEVERQRKLESAAIEYQRKLEQLAVAKQREIEELNRWKQREEEELALWYQRELEEIDRNTQQKIERLLAGYIEEGKIHEEQQAKIHGILVKWFGQNKALVDGLMAYTAQAFSGMAAMAASALSFASMSLPQGQPAPYWQMAAATAGGLAAGGQFVATKPTSALFGEGGEPELVTVTPLSKLASLRGKEPVNGADGMDGRNGQQRIVLDMNLSPDLEARVVERAMDGTADVISKINRSKG